MENWRIFIFCIPGTNGLMFIDNNSSSIFYLWTNKWSPPLAESYLRCRVDCKLELRLFPIVDRQPLHQEGREPRPCAPAEAVKHEEALEADTALGQLPDPLHDDVNHLLADGVVAPGVVVGRVLLAGDELLGVEELPVGAGPHLVHDRRLEVDEDCSGILEKKIKTTKFKIV